VSHIVRDKTITREGSLGRDSRDTRNISQVPQRCLLGESPKKQDNDPGNSKYFEREVSYQRHVIWHERCHMSPYEVPRKTHITANALSLRIRDMSYGKTHVISSLSKDVWQVSLCHTSYEVSRNSCAMSPYEALRKTLVTANALSPRIREMPYGKRHVISSLFCKRAL